MRFWCKGGLAVGLVLAASWLAPAQEKPDFSRTRDVIYGRKFGLALTMDVLTPRKPNGVGVIAVVSGGWFSRPEMINPAFYGDLLRRGYTVFAVLHGSQPKFTNLEILEDLHRAVRFVRVNAKKFGVDPGRLGIVGASAGGHLSLMMGNTGKEGDPKAADPVDRASSTVQAVGAFCPPADFLNWGRKGNELIDRQLRPPFTAAQDYQEFDRKKALYRRVTDKEKLREIARQVSPLYHVKPGSAPAIILHGDKDELVPFQQAELLQAKYREAKVPVKLVVREGGRHVWPTFLKDMSLVADWFDEHLLKAAKKD
jgi:acetyl esterase/lipase